MTTEQWAVTGVRMRPAIAALLFWAGATAMGAEAPPADAASGWATPKRIEKLLPHPRLYVSAEQLQRAVRGRGEAFRDLYDLIAAAAETGVRDADAPMADMSSLNRGVNIQGRLLALAVQWHRTRDRKYLEAALQNVRGMKAWMPPDQINLWEGQYIAGFAIAYDLLYNDLTPAERAEMVALAREHFLKPFLRVTAPRDPQRRLPGERRSWWQDIVSNWNAVCITGGGLLALAMYEDLDEAQTVMDRVHESYQPIFDYLQTTEGGWVEGLGYWNWTIHYMSLFLISHERATGEPHPGFRSPGFRQTLTFGTYFNPHGEVCGFGDNQHGGISDSLLAAAEHIGDREALRALQNYRALRAESERLKAARRAAAAGASAPPRAPSAPPASVNIYYGPVQRLLMEPDPVAEAPEPRIGMWKYYPLQGWGMVADRWPEPAVYGAIRGGRLGGPHTHQDLLSWHGVVGIEKMIHNIFEADYYDTAWESRAHEIYERNCASKNTLFIGGLGPARVREGEPRAEAVGFVLPTGPALRFDATRAFWLTRSNPRMVVRLITTVDDRGLLVLDRVLGRVANPVEARLHTKKEAVFGEREVLLKGEFETARVTFAADRPAVLRRATALRSNPRQTPETALRWQTLNPERDATLAAILTRGADPVDLALETGEGVVKVKIASGAWRREILLNGNLEPAPPAE